MCVLYQELISTYERSYVPILVISAASERWGLFLTLRQWTIPRVRPTCLCLPNVKELVNRGTSVMNVKLVISIHLVLCLLLN